MKRLLLFLFAFFTLAVAAPIEPAFAAPIHIRDFRATVDIGNDGGIVVQERLLVDIPGVGEFRGMYRDIPVVTRWRESGRARMEVLSVSLDGKPRPTDDVRTDKGSVRIYQRDRNTVLRPGLHEFVLTYRMTGQVGFFSPNDELTWNVTGSGWEAPIDRASCTVFCPKGAPFYGQAAWLGGLRSMDESGVSKSYAEKDGRVVMNFRARRAIQPGEQLTVAAGWGKGFVSVTHEGQGMTTFLLAALSGGLFLYFCVTWYLFGRDPAKGTIIARFHPPLTKRGQEDGQPGLMSPAAVGYLAQQALFSPRCFGAALISLSGRGNCHVRGNAKEGFTLELGEGQSPYVEENAILRHLPAGAVLPVDKEHGETLYDMREALQLRLRREYGKLWKGGRGNLLSGLFGSIWTFLGMVAALLGLAAIAGWSSGGALPEEVMVAPLALLMFSFFARNFAKVVSSLWKRRKYLPAVLLTLFLTAFFSLMVGGLLFGTAGSVLLYFTPLQLGLMAAVLLVPFGFSFIMDAPSKEARALLDEIEGLALYIGMAESDRLNAMNPPQQSLEHYQELLPYAVALDLEDAWGARFASVLEAHAAACAENGPDGRPGRDFWSPAMANALASSVSASAASHAASEAASSHSSFGGGGGGGAGSGGGGGGGGGC
ncbi:MAG: DUF2207 domain-containing protein [Mailhella sp.]|nr:DUF2207 domain-containing protein [Mailhella sp.]